MRKEIAILYGKYRRENILSFNSFSKPVGGGTEAKKESCEKKEKVGNGAREKRGRETV